MKRYMVEYFLEFLYIQSSSVSLFIRMIRIYQELGGQRKLGSHMTLFYHVTRSERSRLNCIGSFQNCVRILAG